MTRRPIRAAWFLMLALTACSSQQRQTSTPADGGQSAPPPAAARPREPAAETPDSAPGPLPREEIVERGTESFVGQGGGGRARAGADAEADVNLRFEAADIREFAKVVLGDILGLSYMMDPAVMGTVTINTSRPIARAEVLPLFEQVIGMNSAVLLVQNGLYQVVPRAAARAGGDVSVRGRIEGFGTRIVSLRYISAQEIQKIIAPILPSDTSLTIDTARNLIVVSGTPEELAGVQDLVDLFDVDWLKGMSVGLYPLDFVPAKTMETELIAVFGGLSAKPELGVLGGVLRLVPVERVNSLLVVSSTVAALREAEIWIRRLDQPGESVEQRLYVYPLQNSKATDLADLLGNIFDAGGAARDASAGRVTAPGMPEARVGAPGSADNAPAAADGISIEAGGRVEIMADDVRNALVVLASARDYRMVESAIRKLDTVPLQVLIEASIVEVTLTDDLAYGVEWFFRGTVSENGNERATRGQLDLGPGGIGALQPGFAYTIVDSAARVRFALNALATKSNIDVLSSPSLMVLDNQQATISVGDEIPIPTRQSISNLDPSAPTVNEIAFRQTGLTLVVTPRVNNSGLVTMDIHQEVATAAVTTTSSIDAPTIQNRLVESVVAVSSGETIVLGGMIQDHKTKEDGGVPFLHRIPVIGKAFGQTSRTGSRTELLVLITPRVVRNNDEARSVTDEYRRKLQLVAPAAAAANPKS